LASTPFSGFQAAKASRDAGAARGTGRSPDFGREVRQRRQVIAEDRRLLVNLSSPSCVPSPESPANLMIA
jgi:hypothetical protein